MQSQDPPHYWSIACTELGQADPVMARLISLHQNSFLRSRGDAFTTLSRAIVGQQISVKAAASVWEKLSAAVSPWSAQAVQQKGPSGLVGLGLSARKINYLMDLSLHFCSQPGLARELSECPDAQVIERLMTIRGIGPWTAEMFLMFGLRRPDVFPVRDLGLMKAISLHYKKGQAISIDAAHRIGSRWKPWRSVATWYLWRSLDPIDVNY